MRGRAGPLEQLHRALHVERIAEAGVDVDDQGSRRRGRGSAPRFGDLADGDEPDIGPAEARIGDGGAGDVERLEAGRARSAAPTARRSSRARRRRRLRQVVERRVASAIVTSRDRLSSVAGRCADRGRVPCSTNAAVLEHIGARGDVQRLHHILLDQQNARAPRADALDQPEHLLDEQRRKAERRLVEDQELRLAPSARGRSRASAARRRKACRPAGARAPSAAERCRTRVRGCARGCARPRR